MSEKELTQVDFLRLRISKSTKLDIFTQIHNKLPFHIHFVSAACAVDLLRSREDVWKDSNCLLVCDSRIISTYLSLFYDISQIRGTDFVRFCFKNTSKEIRHVLIGGKDEDQLKRLTNVLKSINSDVQIVGSSCQQFESFSVHEINKIFEIINQCTPDVVWIGIGSPKQDILAHLISKEFKIPCIAIGAAFDFLTNDKKEAPKMLQTIGLEWLFRFTCEPKRLLHRYTVKNLQFILYLFQDLGSRFTRRIN